MPYYKRKRISRGMYRAAGIALRNPNSYLSRRVAGAYRSRNLYNRGTLRAANRLSTAMAFRGWVPGSTLEKKYVDTTVTSGSVSTTGGLSLLNGIAVGNTVNTRVGRKIIIKSIQWKGNVAVEQGADLAVSQLAPVQSVRFMVLIDKQPNGATFATTDLLQTNSVFAPINMAYRDRFIVLKDKLLNLGFVASTATAGQVSGAGNPQVIVNGYKKCSFPVVYGADAGATVADISSNALYFFVLGSVVAGETDSTCNIYFRVRYVDA